MIKYKFITILLFSIATITSCTNTMSVAPSKNSIHDDTHVNQEREDYHEILQMLDEDDVTLAGIALQKFNTRYPNSYRAKIISLELSRKKNDCIAVTNQYQDLKKFDKFPEDDIRIEENLAICDVLTNNYLQADMRVNKILQNDASKWKIINLLGVKDMQQHKYKEAIIYFEAAKEVSSHPSIVNNLALAYIAQNNLSRAQTLLEEVVQNNIYQGYEKKLILTLSIVYALQNQYDKAKSILHRVFDLENTHKIITTYKKSAKSNLQYNLQKQFTRP